MKSKKMWSVLHIWYYHGIMCHKIAQPPHHDLMSEPKTRVSLYMFDPILIKSGENFRKVPREDHVCLLTLSVPGGHGDDPVDSGLSHGADHCFHGLGVSRHHWEDGGREAEAGHDHILSFEMSLQTVCWENISFHHLEAADRETSNADVNFTLYLL